MDDQPKSSKVADSLYQLFKVALSIYHEWITKEKVVKLRSLYIKWLKLRCLCIKSGSLRKSCRVAESLCQVFKVAFSMCEDWIIKEKVLKLRSLYIKCLKLRCLCVMSGSPKKKLKSCGVFISSV